MPPITLPAEPPRNRLVLADVLQALADPMRLEIVARVDRDGETACGTHQPGVPKSTLSHHWRTLRVAGVLTSRRQGKEILNTVRRADLDARFPGLLDAILGGRPGASAREPGRRRPASPAPRANG